MYRILIVEDDFALAEAIRRQLESWGNEALCVQDFQNIIPTFTEYAPHIVLLDVMLPYFNGYHWCCEIRRISNVPIVFLSSASDNMNIIMAMNMGGDDFIAKPIDLNVMTYKLQAILRRAYDMSGSLPFLEYQGAVLNLNNGTLDYNGKSIELTKNVIPHSANADGEQGKGCQPRRADDKAMADGFLCGREYADRKCRQAPPEAGGRSVSRI